MMMSPASTHMATRRRSPLLGFRAARESTLQKDDALLTLLHLFCHVWLCFVFSACAQQLGWLSVPRLQRLSVSLWEGRVQGQCWVWSPDSSDPVCPAHQRHAVAPEGSFSSHQLSLQPFPVTINFSSFALPAPFHIHYTAFWYLLLLLQYWHCLKQINKLFVDYICLPVLFNLIVLKKKSFESCQTNQKTQTICGAFSVQLQVS